MKWRGRKGLAYFYVRLSVTNSEQISLFACRSGCGKKVGVVRKTAATFWDCIFSISRIDSNSEQISLLSCRSDCSEKAWRGAARKTAAAVWNWLSAFSEKLSTFNSFHFYTDAEKRTQNISFFCRNAMQWPPKSVMRGQNIFVKSYADLLLWRCLYSFATFFV